MKRNSVGLVLLSSALLYGHAAFARETLTIYTFVGSDSKKYEALIKEYEKKNNISVKFVYASWDAYFDKLLAMAASGNVPDVMVVDRTHLPRLAQNNILRPVEDYCKAVKFDPKKELSDYKSGVYGDKFYGFSIWGGPNMLYYNSTLFAKSGCQDPNNLIDQGKWKWNDYLEVGRKLTKDLNGDGNPDQFGIEGVTAGWTYDWMAKIHQAGGSMFNDDKSRVTVNGPEAIEGLSFWLDQKSKYGIAPKTGLASFDSGKSGMTYGWLTQSIMRKESLRKKFDMQVTLQPEGKAGYAMVSGGCPVVVSRSGKRPKEAFKLAKWYAVESGLWKIAGAPASKRVFETEYREVLAKSYDRPDIAAKALGYGFPEEYIHPRIQLIQDAYRPILDRMVDGRLSAAAGAKDMAAALERVLARK